MNQFWNYWTNHITVNVSLFRPKQNICGFQVSGPYLGFYPDPKHLTVDCELNAVKFAKKWGKMY